MNDMTWSSELRSGWYELGDGELRLPEDVLRAAGLQPGDHVHIRVADGVVEIRSQKAAILEAQRIVREGIDPSKAIDNLSGVDGLIAERRREAALEEAELRAHNDAAE
ncbi:MAG TPA: AbrB/MazE/SpoVT family DNA-binding domain-containing protein [Bradyrhizobium sp.]|nr:AbrB/MazE/SpoVT family DNA-binding domain-containing protein [Bradyrhizobium sp.]